MVLLVAAQAYAGTVSLSVSKKAGMGAERWATIGYDSNATKPDANVSGFGLKVYTTNPDTVKFTAIADYIVGESNSTTKGYGIFPGGIIINDGNGTVTDWNTPIAPSWDPCCGVGTTGLGTNTIIAELGALYEEGNAPPLSGTLFSVKVDGDCNVCVTGEPLRGNVILTDSNYAILSPVPPICAHITSESDYLDFGDANDVNYRTLRVSDGARHEPIGPKLGVNRDTELNGLPSANCLLDDTTGVPDDEDGVIFAGGRAVTVIVSAPCKLNAWVDFNNNGNFTDPCEQIFINRDLLAAGTYPLVFTVPPTGVVKDVNLISRWRVTDYNLPVGYYYGYATNGEVEDYNMPYISSCYDAPNDGNYTSWNQVGRPYCWCYSRQCHGDADGVRNGISTTTGYWWVGQPDLDILAAGWLVMDTPKGSGVIGRVFTVSGRNIPLVCADFDHKRNGISTTTGYWWIGQPDLDKLAAYWLKMEPPKGSGTPGNCLPGNRLRTAQPY